MYGARISTNVRYTSHCALTLLCSCCDCLFLVCNAALASLNAVGYSTAVASAHNNHKIQDEIEEIDYLKVYYLISDYTNDINIRQTNARLIWRRRKRIRKGARRRRRKTNFPILVEISFIKFVVTFFSSVSCRHSTHIHTAIHTDGNTRVSAMVARLLMQRRMLPIQQTQWQ